MTRVAPLLAGLLLVVATACSSGASGPSVPPQSLRPDSPKIVAKDLKFTTPAVTVPANTIFAIDFDNQEAVPHNVTIYDGKGTVMFRGEIFTGSAHRTYSVTALAPGAYPFKCDVHPDMAGVITAA